MWLDYCVCCTTLLLRSWCRIGCLRSCRRGFVMSVYVCCVVVCLHHHTTTGNPLCISTFRFCKSRCTDIHYILPYAIVDNGVNHFHTVLPLLMPVVIILHDRTWCHYPKVLKSTGVWSWHIQCFIEIYFGIKAMYCITIGLSILNVLCWNNPFNFVKYLYFQQFLCKIPLFYL